MRYLCSALLLMVTCAVVGCGAQSGTTVLPAEGEITRPPADPNTP